jgi:hypothetical protein
MSLCRMTRGAVERGAALVFTVALLASATVPAVAAVAADNAIVDWNTYLLGQVIKDDNRNPPPPGSRPDPTAKGDKPPMVSRQLAMIHAAMFNAVNAVEGRHQPYGGGPRPTGYERANPELAAMYAAHDVALALFDNEQLQARIVSKLNTDLARPKYAGLDDATKRLSERLGKLAAQQVIAMRADDGCNAEVTDYRDDAPNPGSTTTCKSYGQYRMDQFSAGAQLPCASPQWPKVKPFVISKLSEFRTAGPPACTSPEYAKAVEELREKGGRKRYFDLAQYPGGKLPKDVAWEMRTAFFWAEKGLAANGTKTQSGTVTPPGHWNEIATAATAGKDLSVLETARLYAALNLAMADAAVTAWNIKYHYDLWRPIHAIRLAPTDRNDPNCNPGVTADPEWLPLIPTSNHPEYISGHSTFSGAAAAVLTAMLGDNVSFTVTSDDALKINADGLPDEKGAREHRTYARFWDAAREAGRSRIYGGIHYQFSNEDGLRTGERIGQYVLAHALLPAAGGAAAKP